MSHLVREGVFSLWGTLCHFASRCWSPLYQEWGLFWGFLKGSLFGWHLHGGRLVLSAYLCQVLQSGHGLVSWFPGSVCFNHCHFLSKKKHRLVLRHGPSKNGVSIVSATDAASKWTYEKEHLGYVCNHCSLKRGNGMPCGCHAPRYAGFFSGNLRRTWRCDIYSAGDAVPWDVVSAPSANELPYSI